MSDSKTSGRERYTLHGIELRETTLGAPWDDKKHGYFAEGDFHRPGYGGAFDDTAEGALARLVRAQAKREVTHCRDRLSSILRRAEDTPKAQLVQQIENLRDDLHHRRDALNPRYVDTDSSQSGGTNEAD